MVEADGWTDTLMRTQPELEEEEEPDFSSLFCFSSLLDFRPDFFFPMEGELWTEANDGMVRRGMQA